MHRSKSLIRTEQLLRRQYEKHEVRNALYTALMRDEHTPREVLNKVGAVLRSMPLHENVPLSRIKNRCVVNGQIKLASEDYGLCRHVLKNRGRLGLICGLNLRIGLN
eukprot:NODE_8178_length_378_cov_3.410359_g8012_i0.p1 GENE.NODE_8178_length_378_cov_3.410359_g8012_i0~~NODE_8178_length_378_cov_3.410359_g8012_i0.p1  ORF type:complete len:114 (-),score=29.35 NODE_8178_length_378_cov_3.410359_g8012_i0:37-357(-)